jgi:hypothetical protein
MENVVSMMWTDDITSNMELLRSVSVLSMRDCGQDELACGTRVLVLSNESELPADCTVCSDILTLINALDGTDCVIFGGVDVSRHKETAKRVEVTGFADIVMAKKQQCDAKESATMLVLDDGRTMRVSVSGECARTDETPSVVMPQQLLDNAIECDNLLATNLSKLTFDGAYLQQRITTLGAGAFMNLADYM